MLSANGEQFPIDCDHRNQMPAIVAKISIEKGFDDADREYGGVLPELSNNWSEIIVHFCPILAEVSMRLFLMTWSRL